MSYLEQIRAEKEALQLVQEWIDWDRTITDKTLTEREVRFMRLVLRCHNRPETVYKAMKRRLPR